MANSPLISIICTVYNQVGFVIDCLESVVRQGYENFELILIENGSTDGSASLVRTWGEANPHVTIVEVYNSTALPYCKSFNLGLNISTGKYIIDLSGDDQILPKHLERSISKLSRNPAAAFCFSDAELVERDNIIKTYYHRSNSGELLSLVQDGNLYAQIVKGNPILSATLVFDAAKLKAIGGYDEQLVYEDFDIMVRLSRDYVVVFSDHIGIKKTIHDNSFSKRQYLPKVSKMLPSTLIVCQKIKALNNTKEEDEALLRRVMYEAKHSLWSANFEVASGFLEIAKSLKAKSFDYRLFRMWSKVRLDLSIVYLLLKKT